MAEAVEEFTECEVKSLQAKATILCIDNEEHTHAQLKRLFRSAPYAVKTAYNNTEAFEYLQSCPVDLIIYDVSLSHLDNGQFLAKVMVQCPQPILILLTSDVDREVCITALNEGKIYRYISKPCEESDLGASVQQALEQKNLETERNHLLTINKKQNEELKALHQHRQDHINETVELHESYLQSILDSSTDAIIIIDINGIIEVFNKGAENLLGYREEDVIGKNISIMVPEPDKSKHDDYLKNYVGVNKSQIIGRDRELKAIRKDGSTVSVELGVSSFKTKNRVLLVGIAHDITERKRMENQLTDYTERLQIQNFELMKAKNEAESANQLKTEFLSNMSHELRTPMHAIIGFSKYGIENVSSLNCDEHQENLTDICESAEALLILLNDLLDLAKLEAGKAHYSLKSNDIVNIVSSIEKELQPLMQEKELKLKLDSSEQQNLVECDANKLAQVIRNLLNNAIKFTDVNSTITITITREKATDFMLFSIRDEGAGIPEDELESVFDKFVQSSKTRTGAGGTGLGLAICKEIIHHHGGRIWAENEEKGGARFSFMLPVENTFLQEMTG